MQINWKFVTGIAIALVLGVLCAVVFHSIDNKVIETYSAKITQESDQIMAKDAVVITDIAVKNKESVKEGQFIMELSAASVQNCLDKKELTGREQEAATEYEDAAIMYKDGIITQEEYDKSLDEYKNTSAEISKEAACKNNNSEKIYAAKDGIIDLYDSKIGSKADKGNLVATIRPAERRILAYFSQKYLKKIEAGMSAEITIIKYPEKQFTGTVESVDKINMNGIPVIIKINENISDLNINDDDNAVVRIIK